MRYVFALLLLLLALAPATWSSTWLSKNASTSVWMDPHPSIATSVDGVGFSEQAAVSVDVAHFAAQTSAERVGGVSSLFAADLVSPAPAVRSYAGSAGEASGIPCTGLELGLNAPERRLFNVGAFRQRPGTGHVLAVIAHRRSPYRSPEPLASTTHLNSTSTGA